ncbi:MAG: SPOR domain-containing protein [Candidatus Omnitrophica bacterium]|nr:SPOR domain-containing protein [Candidatus Omnitrophota bacterium]
MKAEQLKLFDFREKGEKKLFVSISIDILGFCLILIVLLVVFSYILGVERGKRAFTHIRRESSRQLAAQDAPQEEEISTPVVASTEPEPSGPGEETSSAADGYAIQVASYKFSSAAEREKKMLEQNGYHAKIVKKGEYLVVLVGEYLSRERALESLKDLKSRYKDCFLRRL